MRFFLTSVLVLLFCTLVLAQTGSLKGIVLDVENNRPLEGANVVLIEKNIGTTTAKDGSFSIQKITSGEHTLQVSYVGYTTFRKKIRITASEAPIIVVELHPSILPGQTVVVTATRGRERETPTTYSTLTSKDISKRYSVQDIPQLLSELPSTIFHSDGGHGIGYNYLNIRGFDQKRISVMINGIPQNDPEDHDVYWLDFPDLAASLEDIQVQRGAGSAFYGPPAIGGSVNLITSSYSKQSGVSLYSGYGSFNTRKFSATVNSGLVNQKYIFIGRLGRILSDGYRENSWTDFSSYYFSAIRYDETMTTQINFYGGPVADHLAYYGIPKSEAYSADSKVRRRNPISRPEEIENFSQPHYELLHEWRLSENFVLNNSIFLVTGDGFFDYDGSWAPYSYYRITPQNGFTVTGDPDNLFIPDALIRANVSNVQYGWLPRFSYNHGDGRLTAGLEMRVHRSLHWGALRWGNNMPIGVTPDYRYYEYKGAKDIFSVYAQELYKLRDDLNLLFNLQYVYNKYRLYDEKYVGNDFSVPYHFLNPKFGINYNISGEFNVYTQVSYTSREPRLKNLYDAAEASTPTSWEYKVPQFDTTASGTYDFSKPLVKPERLTNIEIGFTYATEKIRAGINLYSMSFQDEIIKKGTLDRFGQPVTGNAKQTLHQGVELTTTLRPFNGFEFMGNATFSKNRLVEYSVYSGGNLVSLNGNVIAGFPEFLANVRGQYEWNGITIGMSMQHVGDFYTDNFQHPSSPSPLKTVDAYTVCNGFINLEFPFLDKRSIELQFYVNNIFDIKYASHGEGDEFFPAADRNFFASIKINL